VPEMGLIDLREQMPLDALGMPSQLFCRILRGALSRACEEELRMKLQWLSRFFSDQAVGYGFVEACRESRTRGLV